MKEGRWGIIGHAATTDFLARSLEHGLRAHAFILAGPEHVGKSAVADAFTKALLCWDFHERAGTKAGQTPCGTCAACAAVQSGVHPDISSIARDEEKKQISIEQVRALIERLSYSSFSNSYKVAIIRDAQELSESASHALLKLLEEPTQRTIIILTVTDEARLIPTIRSRAQLLRCGVVPAAEMYRALIARGIHRDEAREISGIACGRPGLALRLSTDGEEMTQYRERVRAIVHALTAGAPERAALATLVPKEDSSAADGVAAKQFLTTAQLVVRDILHRGIYGAEDIVHASLEKEITACARIMTPARSQHAIRTLQEAQRLLDANVSPRLAIEHACILL